MFWWLFDGRSLICWFYIKVEDVWDEFKVWGILKILKFSVFFIINVMRKMIFYIEDNIWIVQCLYYYFENDFQQYLRIKSIYWLYHVSLNYNDCFLELVYLSQLIDDLMIFMVYSNWIEIIWKTSKINFVK